MASERDRSADERRRSLQDGHDAETWVAEELARLGWTLLARNVHIGGGELDLVVCRDAAVRFVEVKARAEGEDGLEAITRHKQAKLRFAAEAWLQQAEPVREAAFMVALVTMAPEGWRLELWDDPF